METISCVSASDFERILKAQQNLHERFQYLEQHARRHELYCVIMWIFYVLVIVWLSITAEKPKKT